MRAALAATAERSIDLQYYSVSEDLTTDLLLLRLVEAADRGVRVRVLLDDIEPSARQFAWRAMAASPAIQVRLFNPFYYSGTTALARFVEFSFDSDRLNRRMHNKLWVADNAAAIVGSRNLGAEYFEAGAAGNFHDVDLLAVGPIVDRMSQAFDAFWNGTDAVPARAIVGAPGKDDGLAVRRQLQSRVAMSRAGFEGVQSALAKFHDALLSGKLRLTWAPARFIYDLPGQAKPLVPSGIEHGWMEDHPGGVSTQHELLIVSPYFVPSELGLRHLRSMSERGVRIAVLTNSLASTDSPAAHAGYARHRAALLGTGIELYEVRADPMTPHERPHIWQRALPSSLHAKFIVQDRMHAIVGSLNQDPRSRLHNTEAWVSLHSSELADALATLFEEASDLEHSFRVHLDPVDEVHNLAWETAQDGKMIRYGTEPVADSWLLLWRKILGALIPEHLL